ncbi:CDC45 family [Entophlyctis helioformis]|nr:CDC45 family [Entophlyctis helioformis]
MGIAQFELLDKEYERIRSQALSGGNSGNSGGSGGSGQTGSAAGSSTVLVFVATSDVDSLCALKILVTLLKADCIVHRVVPVNGYDALDASSRSILQSSTQDLRSIILINVGALVDITEYFGDLVQSDAVTLYVVDARRPVNLKNLYGSDAVRVFDDGSAGGGRMADLKAAYEELEFDGDSSEDSGSDSDSGSDDEDGDGVEDAGRNKGREEDGHGDRDSDDSDQGDDEPGDGKDDGDGDGNDDRSTNGGASDNDDDEGDDEDKENRPANRPRPTRPLLAKPDARPTDNTTDGQPLQRKRKTPDAGVQPAATSATTTAAVSGAAAGSGDGRQKRAKRDRQRKLQRRENYRLVAEYYQRGAYHGMSASGLMYQLVTQLGRTSMDFLWFAIVGLTDQFIHSRVSLVQYLRQVELYKDDVRRMQARSVTSASSASAAASASMSLGLGLDLDDLDAARPGQPATTGIAGGGSSGGSGGSGGGRAADDRSIHYFVDLRLALLKHWSLYESLFHSEYVATKLGVWRAKGRQRLTNLLVKMGFPQKESKQIYREMSLPYKRLVDTKLLDLAPKYNMADLSFPSFYRTEGYASVVSASDAVYALAALGDGGVSWLHGGGSDAEAGGQTAGGSGNGNGGRLTVADSRHVHGAILSFRDAGATTDETGGDGGDHGLVGAGVGTRSTAGAIAARVFDDPAHAVIAGSTTPAHTRNFYIALDALTNHHLLLHGTLLAIHFQKLLTRTAFAVLDAKGIQCLAKFRMVVVRSLAVDMAATTASVDAAVVGGSVGLASRLCGFLMDAHEEYRSKPGPRLPFVMVLGLDADAERFLVIGRSGTHGVSDVTKNRFHIAFSNAAQDTDTDVKFDSFESGIATLFRPIVQSTAQ